MSAEDSFKNLIWYLRRKGVESGPFPAALISRYLILGRIHMDDEVSLNRVGWRPIHDYPELIPDVLSMPEGQARDALLLQERLREDERQRERRRRMEKLDTDDRQAGRDRRKPESSEFSQHRDLRETVLSVMPESVENTRRLPLVLVAVAVLLTLMAIVWFMPRQESGSTPDCGAPGGPGVNWSYCRKSGLTADKADLRNAILNNATLTGARFTNADLSGADLSYADLRRASLSRADLTGARLTGARLEGALLNGADLSGADLSYADIRGAVLTGVEFNGAILDRTIWTDGRTCAAGSVGTCR